MQNIKNSLMVVHYYQSMVGGFSETREL